MTEMTPDELRRGAAAARQLGDENMARVYESTADQIEKRTPGAAATASEGEESNTHEGNSMSSIADPTRHIVLLIVAGLQKAIVHATTFRGAIDLIEADAAQRFGPDAIDYKVITGDYVRMTTTVGLEVEYRIIPHDQLVPEDEPSAHEIDGFGGDGDADEIEQIDSVVIDSANGLTAIVETFRGVATVSFTNHPDRLDAPELRVDDIPHLIGALGRFYAEHHTPVRQLRRDEARIRAAADVREGL